MGAQSGARWSARVEKWWRRRLLKWPARRREWLTSRSLLHTFDGAQSDFLLLKDVHGKPYLAGRNYHISLSHTAHYTAIAHAPVACGVDVQVWTQKVARVAHKFMHETEWTALHASGMHETRLLHYYWSAKEAVYKAWGKKELAFKAIHIALYDAAGRATATVYKNGAAAAHYHLQLMDSDDFMLVVAVAA